jgi:hypothetical protein
VHCLSIKHRRRYKGLLLCFAVALLTAPTSAQDQDAKPIPILTGNAGFFTNGEAGHTEIVSEINPVLLVPLGDHWLIESRGEFEGDFARKDGNGPFGGVVDKELNYLQVDYIANPYVTVTAGRFLTPFGIYNERLYPIWIRSLQPEPLIFGMEESSSNGAMLRGGFPLNSSVNLNYTTYFSVNTTNHVLDADRSVGGRIGFFLPGPRVEAGFSWRKLLQEERTNALGFHFAWQPNSQPLNLRSEYARSNLGSGYWIEGAYRLSKIARWNKVMRNMEVVGRAQQFFGGKADDDDVEEYELPDESAQQEDIGFNYYLRDGLKATASYGRQFKADGDFNIWSVGIAYRFALPLGPRGW